MMNLAHFEHDLDELNDLHQKLLGSRATILRNQTQKTQELVRLKDDLGELQKVKAVLDDLIKTFIGFQLDKIKEYVSYGLRTVMPDQDLRFECNITTKMNKPWVEFLTVNADGVSARALEGFGGSVAQIESLILRVLAILQLKMYPLLLLDESLNAVSDEYLKNLSMLLGELSRKLKIKILLVTHNKDILVHADRIYKATETKSGLRLEDLRVTEGH